jgi:phosphoribosylpyrophosphate synthetase
VFAGGGLERIAGIQQIREIVTTNTVRIVPEVRHPKLHVLTAAPVFGEAIRRNCLRQSIGNLAAAAGDELDDPEAGEEEEEEGDASIT